ncbi:hypothetical protein SKAU_G00305720 [Synaphobranchus kaupii]|uniref:Uncharacterized protein n=1 Tax=Synaphobranchus kaupii TaxID=118154 RepID=A0A9Q1IKJ2_SYNKA|nr:hypothetical protein SKAU_G00305720 [Synaphobranchus kaupii]
MAIPQLWNDLPQMLQEAVCVSFVGPLFSTCHLYPQGEVGRGGDRTAGDQPRRKRCSESETEQDEALKVLDFNTFYVCNICGQRFYELHDGDSPFPTVYRCALIGLWGPR